jgi:cytochrome c553
MAHLIPIAVFALLTLLAPVSYGAVDSTQQLMQQCIACHGENAQGNDASGAPSLAGQYEWYISRQLSNFKSGLRGSHPEDVGGQQMRAVLSQISSDEEIQSLSLYLSSLPSSESKPQVTGDIKNGSRYYQAKCGACHGGKAEGNSAFKAPRLAGLSEQYLQLQLDKFSQGLRGTHSDDKLGRQMAAMAKNVSGQVRDDIIFFITEQE